MLIRRSFRKDIETTDYEVTGLIKARRTLFLFVDKESLNAGTVMKAKCAIVNECVYDSKKSYTHSLVVPGSHFIRNAVYFGDVTANVIGNITHGENIFTLDNCVAKEKQIVPHGDTISYDPNYYSVKMASYNICDIEMSGIANSYENLNIPPQFYNEYHMCLMTGDYVDLLTEPFGSKTKLKDLITKECKVVMMDASKYDTMRLSLTNRILDAETVCKDSMDLNNIIGNAFDEYCGHGAIFIYDSNVKGSGHDGVGIQEGYVPYGTWYNPEYLGKNLNQALTAFSLNCKDVEAQYGDIRVLFAPGSLGNRYKIRFKEYKPNNQPFPMLGNFDNVNNTRTNFVLNSVDSGYTNDRWITDTIRSSEKAEQTNFMAQMNGYI